MSDRDREIWDARYAAGAYAERNHPSPLLQQWLSPSTRGQRALDLACGAGRNAMYLAAAGYHVDAVDISSIGLTRAAQSATALHLEINWQQADLDNFELPREAYDLIIMLRYVNTPLMHDLARALKPEGYFLCEQHLRVLYPSATLIGPHQTAFRVAPGALLTACDSLRILKARERITTQLGKGQIALAQVLAQKKLPLQHCAERSVA